MSTVTPADALAFITPSTVLQPEIEAMTAAAQRWLPLADAQDLARHVAQRAIGEAEERRTTVPRLTAGDIGAIAANAIRSRRERSVTRIALADVWTCAEAMGVAWMGVRP